MPSSSWIRECYGELAQGARVLVGLPDGWGTCSRTIPVAGEPSAFSNWGDVIAVGLGSSTVLLLDAITGSRKFVLSGHTDRVVVLAFSLDGTLLVSGSHDKTVKLWDVRTGDIIKTFSDHTSTILTVSISSDRTTIASGTEDGAVYLWNVRTGKCHPTPLCHDGRVTGISFSPTDSQRFISSSWDRTIRWWDVDGRQIGAPCHEEGRVAHVAYSLDGTRFVSCGGGVATVRDSKSGKVVIKLYAPKQCVQLKSCCFSPNGRFVACAAANAIYVWEITNSEARLVGNLVGHSKPIISIAFSSFLFSASQDRYMKVWQSNTFSMDPIKPEIPAQLRSPPVESIHLFTEEGIVVTSDSTGVVKVHDLRTGICETSFPTPAKGIQDTHLVDDTLVVVWWEVGDRAYWIWDVGNNQLLQKIPGSLEEISDIRISEDGTKIFGFGGGRIEARSIQTGESVGHVEVRQPGDVGRQGRLVVYGSKVWLADSKGVGWDFGGGKTVFHLPEGYMKPGMRRRLDGRYLLVWSRSGEVVVIDLNCVFDRDL